MAGSRPRGDLFPVSMSVATSRLNVCSIRWWWRSWSWACCPVTSSPPRSSTTTPSCYAGSAGSSNWPVPGRICMIRSAWGWSIRRWWSGPACSAARAPRWCRSSASPNWARCRAPVRWPPGALVADALDLRYRLPMLWRQVQAGQVRAWQARKVAEQTRPLSWDACVELDAALSGFMAMMTWSRFQTILTAAILDADPELAAEREDRARQARDVWACDSDDGLKTLIAKATIGGCGVVLATINRIADILAADGDSDPVGVRRSKAIGILAAAGAGVGAAGRPPRRPHPYRSDRTGQRGRPRRSRTTPTSEDFDS